MVNCPKCGAPFKEGEKFCPVCGAKIEAHATSTSQSMPAYTPQTAKITNKGLIIGIIAIIAIVIAALIIVVILLGVGGGDGSIVGSWSSSEMGGGLMIFEDDGTLKSGGGGFGSLEIGTWSTNGNQLCLEFSIGGSDNILGDSDMPCFTYSISGDTMTWYIGGQSTTFTRQ